MIKMKKIALLMLATIGLLFLIAVAGWINDLILFLVSIRRI